VRPVQVNGALERQALKVSDPVRGDRVRGGTSGQESKSMYVTADVKDKYQRVYQR
jgi:hypothetical protein